ncbi:hypothetical protein YTPLAS72_34770 [Nitrospira sp.]|nr:hypothetical protein YTPLAS72_34770 [Nitrospira sp.]
MDFHGKTIVLVEGEGIAAQMRNAAPVLVVQIERDEKHPLFTVGLNDQLFFSMNPNDPVAISKEVGPNAKFKAWLGKDPTGYGVTRGAGLTRHRWFIHSRLSNLDGASAFRDWCKAWAVP